MSDSSGTILKIATALTSPKTSIKFISIAATLIISWKSLAKELESFQIPGEHNSIILLFISIGLGSLAGELIYFLLSTTHKLTLGKLKERIDEKIKLKELESKNEKILNHFKITYKKISKEARRMLWSLSEEEQLIWDDTDSNYYIDAQLENGYVKKFSSVNESSSIYQLHPVIKKYLQENIEIEISEAFSRLKDDTSKAKQDFISVVTGSSNTASSNANDILEFCKLHSEIAEYQYSYEDSEDGHTSVVSGYYFEIDEYHAKRFEAEFGVRPSKKAFVPL